MELLEGAALNIDAAVLDGKAQAFDIDRRLGRNQLTNELNGMAQHP